ncbi:hypothetical protein KXD40_000810 [Peronospora effusa]|nr:hypothetical protein KXD40_000810 [Peronospora effusa]
MYSNISRTMWQQPTLLKRTLPTPQSQTSIQEMQQQSFQSGWTKDTNSDVGYSTSTNQDQRMYVFSPTLSSVPTSLPPYVWTDEQPPSARTNQFLPSPTYPLPLMAVSELDVRAQGMQLQIYQKSHAQTVIRRSKQIAIGRWNSEEHQWFLKGLNMFQVPAWSEIARLIGTRTPTQVRTHAQKFFTKLARFNQTMPYFEVQIQKERARLVEKGASVTSTAQSASNGSLSATLSPFKHLTKNSLRQSLIQFKEKTSPTLQAQYPQKTHDIKPRLYADSAVRYSSMTYPLLAKEWTQQ